MEMDDAALIAAISQGSEPAFNRLIDRHQQAVRTFVRGLTTRDEAEDIAQETFLVAWKQADSFRGDASVRSWLFSIAWRKAKDGQRSWFRRSQRDTDYLEVAGDQFDSTPAELRVAIARALALLPLPQRAAVMLCLAHGFSHAEAAEALALPLGTVKSHVARGRDILQQALGEDW